MKNRLNGAWLWNKLTPQEKSEACLLVLGDKESSAGVVMMLASVLRFRPAALKKRPRAEVAGLLASSMTTLGMRDGLEPVMRDWLLASKGAVITAFLDGSAIAHEGLFLKDDAVAPTAEAVQGGIKAILAAASPRDIELYLGYLLIFGEPDFWQALHAMVDSEDPLLSGMFAKEPA